MLLVCYGSWKTIESTLTGECESEWLPCVCVCLGRNHGNRNKHRASVHTFIRYTPCMLIDFCGSFPAVYLSVVQETVMSLSFVCLGVGTCECMFVFKRTHVCVCVNGWVEVLNLRCLCVHACCHCQLSSPIRGKTSFLLLCRGFDTQTGTHNINRKRTNIWIIYLQPRQSSISHYHKQ